MTLVQGFCQTAGTPGAAKSFKLSMQTMVGGLHCLIDKEPIDATLSSDGEAIIVSGTDYVLVRELSRCKAGVPVHVRRAAPNVGFLMDINVKAGIYASMVPVAVSPLSFVAVVGKVGSDVNLIEMPGFYRTTVSDSKLKEEASPDMKPVISLDGKYVSLDRHRCGEDSKLDVVEIKTKKIVEIDIKLCERLFNFGE
ncbi:hypothetical protein [Burkholderia sp. LMG 21824]|uniref:hypothetical protein n=1 Tax=Burkholderia sp. LMG 21824 TaxID=3158172 RepID=UPI003C2F269F